MRLTADFEPVPVTAAFTACGKICIVGILACTPANSAIAMTLAVEHAIAQFKALGREGYQQALGGNACHKR